jgi:hypothetical protein
MSVTTDGRQSHSDAWDSDPMGLRLSPASTMVLGAVAGLAFGYLYFTEHGRQLRARFEPMLDTWAEELRKLRDTADKARVAYAEGRDSLAAMTRVTHAPRGE